MLALLLLSGLGVATSAIQRRLRNAEPLRVADATWADLLCLCNRCGATLPTGVVRDCGAPDLGGETLILVTVTSGLSRGCFFWLSWCRSGGRSSSRQSQTDKE